MDERQCVLLKRYYLGRRAHEAYREKLVESRVGANITEDELLMLDEIVSPLVTRGQSGHHIVTHNPNQFQVSEKSILPLRIRRLTHCQNILMPRVCRTKPRKSKPVEHKVDSSCRVGRTYADFYRSWKHQVFQLWRWTRLSGASAARSCSL